MRPILSFLAVVLLCAPVRGQPRFSPEPLNNPRAFDAQATDILDTAKASLEAGAEAAHLSSAQTSRAVEQVAQVLDAWMSYDRTQYDALMESWGGTPRYSADGKDTQAYGWVTHSWRTKDHPFAITRVDLDSFEFVVVDDQHGQAWRSKSGTNVTPTFFRFDPDSARLTSDPGATVAEFRMLVETADQQTHTLALRFVWSAPAARWLPVMLQRTDDSAPCPMFYF